MKHLHKAVGEGLRKSYLWTDPVQASRNWEFRKSLSRLKGIIRTLYSMSAMKHEARSYAIVCPRWTLRERRTTCLSGSYQRSRKVVFG